MKKNKHGFEPKGVRPLCVLKSEILKSYLNGENAEEQTAGNAN